jgi:hypothetical protein
MKKIIDGKRYDTNTATKIAGWDNGLGSSDFNNCSEELYKTKSGNWFKYGEGGPMSAYSVSCGNKSWGGGSDIVPMTEDESFEFLQEHDMDACEEHFASRLQDA